MKFRPAFIFLTVISCSTGRDNKAPISPIDSLIESKMAQSGVVGLAAAVIVDKKLAWAKGYGYADREKKRPFTANTIMNIASISKTITGACVMQAVGEGRLSLDEDVNTYLPFRIINPYFPKEKITLRYLATHTSTILDTSPAYESTYHFGGDSPESLGDFLEGYLRPGGKYYKADNFLKYKPGTHRAYSNIAAGLAGYIVEVVMGEKLNAYSKRTIFKPLQMDDTGWFLTEINLENHSTLYQKEGDSVIAVGLYGLTTYPDGGVRTSVTDLSKFLTCVLNNGQAGGETVLKSELVDEMIRSQFSESWRPDSTDLVEDNRGIFWFLNSDGRQGHTGEDPGVRTVMHYNHKKQIGIILFMNTTVEDAYSQISAELWKHGEMMKGSKQRNGDH